MPGIDASIPLGVQQPQPLQSLSSLLGIKSQINQQALQAQALQSGAMQNQQSAIDLQETQAAQGLMRNIKQYQDDQGNIDFGKLTPDMMQAAPKNAPKFLANLAGMQQAKTQAQQAVNTLDADSRSQVGQIMYSLKGQPAEVVANTADQLEKQYPQLRPALGLFRGALTAANGQAAVDDLVDRAGRMIQPTNTQQDMTSPALSFVPTAQGTQPFNTKAGVPGMPIGPTGGPLTPPNQVIQTTGGGAAIGNTATGAVKPFGSGPAVDFPQGETAQTQAELQNQRIAAQQAAVQAPVQHNLNRSIIELADTNPSTGKGGALLQDISSRFGFKLSGDTATDYNLLGKFLERSALSAAQGMGPHTNAGLEAQVRANGSTDYTPQAIRKIAVLNDALTTGTTLYQQGLERNIQGNVFAKRDFDQKWAAAMNPTGGVDGVTALRFKNAVDAGDQKDMAEIVKQVGGPKSPGARALYSKLSQIRSLAGDQ